MHQHLGNLPRAAWPMAGGQGAQAVLWTLGVAKGGGQAAIGVQAGRTKTCLKNKCLRSDECTNGGLAGWLAGWVDGWMRGTEAGKEGREREREEGKKEGQKDGRLAGTAALHAESCGWQVGTGRRSRPGLRLRGARITLRFPPSPLSPSVPTPPPGDPHSPSP